MRFVAVMVTLFCAAPVFAQKMNVKIVDRQDNETNYSYVVPGRLYSNSSENANCNSNGFGVNCKGTSNTVVTSTPAQEISYSVRGATLSLQLPDGRIAVVNCESKFAEHFAGPAGNHRSCRIPLVDDVQTDFKGDKAKLEWSVSLDGKKTQSETYKILAILNVPVTQ